MGGMRNQLREHTKSSHAQLDSFVGSIEPFNSRDGYACYLQGMYWLYQAYAPAYDLASSAAGLRPVSGIHQANIVADLGRLPLAKPELADSISLEQQIAVGYVLEGSAMGARYMIKTVTEASFSTSYLELLVEESYQRWPRLVEWLDEVETEADENKAIGFAKQVFETAQQSFSESASELGLTQ